MNEKENKNLLYAMQSLGAVLEDKDYTIRAKQFRINELEQQVNELTAKLVNECGSEEQYESTIKAQKEHIVNLEAKIYDLEERIAIMTETEAPKRACEFPMSDDAPLAPMWDITPAAKEVTEVTNVTRVIEEGEEA